VSELISKIITGTQLLEMGEKDQEQCEGAEKTYRHILPGKHFLYFTFLNIIINEEETINFMSKNVFYIKF
jgi:hypothetical protein